MKAEYSAEDLRKIVGNLLNSAKPQGIYAYHEKILCGNVSRIK